MRLFSRSRQASKLEQPVCIDFRTDTPEHRHRAPGVGVHELAVPAQVDTILFDGQPVNFQNGETVDKALKAAREIEMLRRQGITADCFAFAALFSGAVQAEQVPKGEKYWLDFETGNERVDPANITDGQAIAIGAQFHDMDRPLIYHGLVAAEIDETMMFFHVLGDDGPLALSGINQALRVFKSMHIRNISSFKVED